MQHLIHLEWYRDPAGYRLTDERVHDDMGRAPTILSGTVASAAIVPNGKSRRPYFPLKDNPCLFYEFAKVEDPRQLVMFCNKYGLLSQGERDVIEDDIAAAARLMKAINATEARAIDAGLVETGLIFSRELKYYDIYFKPRTLLTGLWLQFWVAHAQNSEVSLCLGCRAPFKRGPNTGRRADAKFCCDEHRVNYHSVLRNRH